MSAPKLLVIESMCKGVSLDSRIPGEVVSFAGKLDGEDCQILIDRESYKKILRNVIHWTMTEGLKGMGEPADHEVEDKSEKRDAAGSKS